MTPSLRFLINILLFMLLVNGCSGKGNPAVPDSDPASPPGTELTPDREPVEFTSNRYPLLQNQIYFDLSDPDNPRFEIEPLREGLFHLNILKFLEFYPCTDCFEITGFSYPQPGTINVDIKITHPFDDPTYTLFDVRGIIMFAGHYYLGETHNYLAVPWIGDGALLNSEGYSALFRAATMGQSAPDIQKYYLGEYATNLLPITYMSGYLRHISGDPANTRNAFYAGDSITRTYSLLFPEDEFRIGYAVDASWDFPIETPVDDPMTDFAISANCSEPWQILVTQHPVGDGLKDWGGTTILEFDVYDWQGNDSHEPPGIECHELYDGKLTPEFIEETDQYSSYQFAVTNEKLAPGGYYPCVITVRDYDDEGSTPAIEMIAFQVVVLRVMGKPTAIAAADPETQDINVPIHFTGTDSYDGDGGEITLYEWDWDNDGIYDDTGSEIDHSWAESGPKHIQLRVTDDEGLIDVLDEAQMVLITGAGIPANPVDITPDWFLRCPAGVFLDGNLAYVVINPPGLVIFDISDPMNPVELSNTPLPDETAILTVSDGYAYVSQDYIKSTLAIVNVFQPENPYIVNTMDVGSIIALVVKDGYLYIGSWGTFTIYNVNTPENPWLVSKFELTKQDYLDPYSWNMLTEQGGCAGIAFSGEYVYVSDRHYEAPPSWLHKLNISDPENPVFVESFEITCDTLNSYADKIVIQTNYRIKIWDTLLEPDGLVADLYFPTYNNNRGFDPWVAPNGIAGAVHNNDNNNDKFWQFYLVDIDPAEEIHIAYETPLNRETFGDGNEEVAVLVDNSSVSIWDTSQPQSTYMMNKIDYPGACYDIEISGDTIYVATETGLKVYDVDPLTSAYQISELEIDSGLQELVYDSPYLYAASTESALHIIDVSDPLNPTIADTVIVTYYEIESMCVSDGYAYLVDDHETMRIIDVDPVGSASIVKSMIYSYGLSDIDIADGYAYVAGNSTSVDIIDIDPPESAHSVAVIEWEMFGFYIKPTIKTWGHYVNIMANNLGIGTTLLIYDISSPEQPVYINKMELPVAPQETVVYGNYAFTASDTGVMVLDISSPENPFVLNQIQLRSYGNDLAISDNRIFVATDSGVQVFDLW